MVGGVQPRAGGTVQSGGDAAPIYSSEGHFRPLPVHPRASLPQPSNTGPEASRQVFYRLSLAPQVNRDRTDECLTFSRHCAEGEALLLLLFFFEALWS